jgi:hypothetical protein
MANLQSSWRSVLGRFARFLWKRPTLLVIAIAFLGASVAWLATPRTSPDYQKVAAPLITALERFHRLHGRYPADLDLLVSESLLPAIPRMPWTAGVTRDRFGYEVDPSGDFYTLFYSEQDWFGGVGPPSAKTYRYPSAFGEWGIDLCSPENQALELAGRKFLSDRSSKSLSSVVSILDKRFVRARWENVSAVLSAGRTCAVEGHAGVCVKGADAEAVEYCFVPREREVLGEIVQEVSTVYQLNSSGSGPTWHVVFRGK